jgi:PST family polysaccharide transporter
MARFGFPMVAQDMVERVRDVIESVVVGRHLDAASLGQYRYGKRLGLLPGVGVLEIGAYVLFPAFSRISSDPVRLRSAFLRVLTWLWFAVAPVSALLVALGEPLVVILLGEPWREASIAMMSLIGYGLGEAMNAVSYESMKGAGRSERLNWMNGLSLVLGVGLLFALVPWGLLGVGLAFSATSILVGVAGLFTACGVVGVPFGAALARMVPGTVGALVALAVVAPFEHLVAHADRHSFIAGLAILALESIAFAVIYVITVAIVAPDMGRHIRETAAAAMTRVVATLR